MMAELEQFLLTRRRPTEAGKPYVVSAEDIRARIMAKIYMTADGHWFWQGARTGSGAPRLFGGIYGSGNSRTINVRRWLWEQQAGFTLAMPLRPCEKHEACVNPDHTTSRYDLLIIGHAVAALQQGQPQSVVSKQYGLPRGFLRQLLTPEEHDRLKRFQEDHRFWAHVDQTREHWVWQGSVRVIYHQGRQISVAHKAWLVSGRTIRSGYILRRTCPIRRCVKPDCQREVYAPALRVRKEKRTALAAKRHAEIVELVVRYGWSQEKVSTLFGCSKSLVCQVIYRHRTTNAR